MKQRIIAHVSLVVLAMTFVVISLGAFTRLTNAGLSCPDWPGCYGRLIAPLNATMMPAAEKHFGKKIVVAKAWTEMMHRYVAAFLGILLLGLCVLVLVHALTEKRLHLVIPMCITMVLLCVQVMLGRFTVTLKLLPVIVSLHLLTALFILALVWWVYLRVNGEVSWQKNHIMLRMMALSGFIFALVQIMLGVWTSSNYAAVSCAGFPFCHVGNMPMQYDFRGAFNLFSPIGIDYEGGSLTGMLRQTIHMVHRYGAFVLGLYTVVLLFFVLNTKPLPRLAFRAVMIIVGALGVQVILGIMNSLMQRPLFVALLHNIMAAVLLLAFVSMNYHLNFIPLNRPAHA